MLNELHLLVRIMIIPILVLNHLPANGAMNDLLIHVDPAGWGPRWLLRSVA